MFLDEKELLVRAGKGGDGAILFRREIYVPRGGPDGGDGGRGGDVIITSKHNLNTLVHLAHTDKIIAEDGKIGGHRRSTGKSGKESIIEVPVGTEVFHVTDRGQTSLVELLEDGQTLRIAKGGNGGWGNWRFRSSIQQAPERANPGQEGEQKHIRLLLKLIADVGLVGLPNAGKSTLLSSISAAHPKIADYPFTTLEPQLGVAQLGHGKDVQHIVVADLPGLIEGANQGKGLGSTFLRHIERTRSLLHCIDAQAEPEQLLENYRLIRQELEGWSKELGEKPEIIVLTKADTVTPDELQLRVSFLSDQLHKTVYSISAASHQGIKELLTALL